MSVDKSIDKSKDLKDLKVLYGRYLGNDKFGRMRFAYLDDEKDTMNTMMYLNTYASKYPELKKPYFNNEFVAKMAPKAFIEPKQPIKKTIGLPLKIECQFQEYKFIDDKSQQINGWYIKILSLSLIS